jgi:hypothetical protein
LSLGTRPTPRTIAAKLAGILTDEDIRSIIDYWHERERKR